MKQKIKNVKFNRIIFIIIYVIYEYYICLKLDYRNNIILSMLYNYDIRTSELYWRFLVHSFYLTHLDYFEVNQPKKSIIADSKFY